MSESGSGSTDMRPAYEDIQAHYDISNDFFGLYQGSSPRTWEWGDRATRLGL